MSRATAYQSFDLPSRHLDIGRVWRKTSDVFGVSTRNFIICGLLPVPAALAAIIPAWLIEGQQFASVSLSVILALLQIVLLAVAQAAATYGVGRVLSGERFTVSEALAATVGRLPQLIGASILAGIVVATGLALFVVPGLVALVTLSLVPGGCVFEHLGPMAALRRSVELAKGNLWRIVGSFALVVGVPFAAVIGVGGTLVGVFYAMHTEFSLVVTAGLSAIIAILSVMIFPAISMVLVAVLFIELRRIRDGSGADHAI